MASLPGLLLRADQDDALRVCLHSGLTFTVGQSTHDLRRLIATHIAWRCREAERRVLPVGDTHLGAWLRKGCGR